LMQLASWLLLHRAVKEGEVSLAQAHKEKAKVKLSGLEHADEQNIKLLPERLRSLIQRSKALQSAVRRLDATIHSSPARADRGNPVERHLGLLRAAFEHEWSRRGCCALAPARIGRKCYFLAPMPANFFWKRESRPPRSSNCCWPPVQAGCDFGSMSRRRMSPSLPQVVRVVNSVPSVIMILTV